MIAILGATGYIGRSLAHALTTRGDDMTLFARDPSRLEDGGWPSNIALRSLDHFRADDFQLVVNALGAGDPAQLATMGASILDVTQYWDQRVLQTYGQNTQYVFLSSGAVYGVFEGPVDQTSRLCLPVNDLAAVPPYTMAKLYTEARHRYEAQRSILDVRVFAYADTSISRSGNFFLSQLAKSIETRSPFYTSADDMVRDYAGVQELVALIDSWRTGGAYNCAVDLYSVEPVSKWDLLHEAQTRYNLEISVVERTNQPAPTGNKSVYFTNNRSAAVMGYEPRRSSREVVLSVLDEIYRHRDSAFG